MRSESFVRFPHFVELQPRARRHLEYFPRRLFKSLAEDERLAAKDDALIAMPDTKTVRVTPAWLRDSLQIGAALPEDHYPVPSAHREPALRA